MIPAFAVKPVAVNEVAVGIEIAEERIRQRHFPDIVLDLDPVVDDFRAFDLDLLARRPDRQSVSVRRNRPTGGVTRYAIDAFMDGDRVTWLRASATRRMVRSGAALDPGLASSPFVATWNSVAGSVTANAATARNGKIVVFIVCHRTLGGGDFSVESVSANRPLDSSFQVLLY